MHEGMEQSDLGSEDKMLTHWASFGTRQMGTTLVSKCMV